MILNKKVFMILIHTVFLITATPYCYSDNSYNENDRVDYIEKVMLAFQSTNSHILNNTKKYIDVVERNNCRTSLENLKVQCLLTYAENNCKELRNEKARNHCELYSDIMITNKMSEDSFIDTSERYRILKKSHQDYRTTINNRLSQKYARITTQFVLSPLSECKAKDIHCLSRGLDQFCLNYTNSQDISWQYCISASVWLIGTSK